MTVTSARTTSTTLRRRAQWLVRATIAWNAIEAVVAVSAGVAAGSAALLGFGLDSAVEVSAAIVALWYLRGADDSRGLMAGRLMGLSFWALAAWVTVDAVGALAAWTEPEHSAAGITMTALSLVVMPGLAMAKRRTGQALGSKALVSESNQTAVCAYLSAAVLIGLLLSGIGWHWADPVAALVVAAIAAREGAEAWRGELGEGGCC